MNPAPSDLMIAAVAAEVRHALDHGAPLAPPSERVAGFGSAAAHGVARRLWQGRLAGGRQTAGRKIGFTNRSIWPLYGVWAPIWGAMYDDTLQAAPTGAATLSLRGLREPRIEPEVVLHLASAPQPGEDAQALLQRVDRVAHAFEVVHSVYPGWRFTHADALAAGSLHGALVIGPDVPLADLAADPLTALSTFTIELSRDGRPVARGDGAAVLDGPLQALAHLVAGLRDRPADEALQASEWISTGTLTDAQPVAPGQTWTTRLHGIALPGLSLSFTD